MAFTAYGIHCEDILLARALRDISHEDGFYIDVGANHPTHDSVTKLFYDHGWRGINVEPSPSWFALLAKERPRDINLQAAATNFEGVVTLFDHPEGGLATAVESYADRHQEAYNIDKRPVEVKATTLTRICEEYAPKDIHFLKIDVEGLEKAVLEGMDFQRFRPWILCVEAVEPMRMDKPAYAEWEPIPLAAGYDFVQSDDLNRWYLARERPERRCAFQYRVDDYVHFSRLQQVEALEQRVRDLDRAILLSREQALAPPASKPEPAPSFWRRAFASLRGQTS